MRFTSRAAILCMAGFTAVALEGTSSANAAQSWEGEHTTQYRAAGAPLLAVIALAQQRVSIYGASGKIMESPVSTGIKGRDTPAGIYSILEKEEEHHSNLYDDASMPFMQRLTWTGIAMHAGVVPGYPASHGCTRLSYGFAEKLYQATKPGMRVVIVREDIAPAEIEQPEIFNHGRLIEPDVSPFWINATKSLSEAERQARLQAVKAAKLAEAETAKERELKARSVAAYKTAEAAAAVRSAEAAAANLARAEAALNAGEHMPETVSKRTENPEAARTLEAAKVRTARFQFERARLLEQVKIDAAAQAEEAAKRAAALSSESAEAAETARENAWPISVFVSRKAQRLYIRRGREPVFEGPVTIRDPDKPIGTFVFTALGDTGTPGRMRWSVVSMYQNATSIEPYSEAARVTKRRRDAKPADVAGARTALQRLVVPQEALDHISGTLLPGSSLIVSDEATGADTGKDTDFIVFMSGEPQGGGAFRSITEADAGDERRQSRAERRKTSSSSSRSRPRAGGVVWRSREYSPFSSVFGF
jgi:chemotaxis protein histidine kinase CheA